MLPTRKSLSIGVIRQLWLPVLVFGAVLLLTLAASTWVESVVIGVSVTQTQLSALVISGAFFLTVIIFVGKTHNVWRVSLIRRGLYTTVSAVLVGLLTNVVLHYWWHLLFNSEVLVTTISQELLFFMMLGASGFAIGTIPQLYTLASSREYPLLPTFALLSGQASVIVFAITVGSGEFVTWVLNCALAVMLLVNGHFLSAVNVRWNATHSHLEAHRVLLTESLFQQDKFLSLVRASLHNGPLQDVSSLALLASSVNGVSTRSVRNLARSSVESLREVLKMEGVTSHTPFDTVKIVNHKLGVYLGGGAVVRLDGDLWDELDVSERYLVNEVIVETLSYHARWDAVSHAEVSVTQGEGSQTVLEITVYGDMLRRNYAGINTRMRSLITRSHAQVRTVEHGEGNRTTVIF